MGLADVKKHEAKSLEAERRREALGEAAFRGRVAAQQFLKHHGPLMRAFARLGGPASDMVKPGEFARRALQARALAVGVAARLADKEPDQVAMGEARHFRQEAAEMVAESWERNEPIDIDRTADEIAGALAIADGEYDARTIEWGKVTGGGSLAMTSASVGLSLARLVALYDFRLGRRVALARVMQAVVTSTTEAVERLVPPEGTPEDRRSLSQTVMQALSGIMADIYEASARDTVAALLEVPHEERLAWLRRDEPLERVVENFREWAEGAVGICLDVSREAVASVRSEPGRDPSR